MQREVVTGAVGEGLGLWYGQGESRAVGLVI